MTTANYTVSLQHQNQWLYQNMKRFKLCSDQHALFNTTRQGISRSVFDLLIPC